MKTKSQWFLLKTEEDYQRATARYEEVKHATSGEERKEKLLLVHLIETYETVRWDLPEIDPVEMIKIRMKDFNYKPADLAVLYGDKGTISKVLNYKQALSLTMIRKFSNFLRLPVAGLIKEYDLKQ